MSATGGFHGDRTLQHHPMLAATAISPSPRRTRRLVALVGDEAVAALALVDAEQADRLEQLGEVAHAVIARIDRRLALRRAARLSRQPFRPALRQSP